MLYALGRECRCGMMIVAAALAVSLAAEMAGAKGIAECAAESGETAVAFVRRSFDTRELKLYDGTRVTVALSHSPCLAHNSVNRVLVYAQTATGYRLALDDYGFTDNVEAGADGTVTLSSHETVEIIDEATYVWNGVKYVFSPERSHRYDVAIGQGRPYVVHVRFAPGALSVVLTGTVAGGFGDSYEFDARAGQRVTIQILKGSKYVGFDVYRDVPGSGDARQLTPAGNNARTWSGILPSSGTWQLDVSGPGSMDHTTTAPYSLVLTIH